GDQSSKSSWIKIIERAAQLAKIDNFQLPAAPQIRSGLQRTVIPRFIVARDLDRVLSASKNLQSGGVLIVAVTKEKTAAARSANEKLAEAALVAQNRAE